MVFEAFRQMKLVPQPAGTAGATVGKPTYWTFVRPVYRNHLSPCTEGCPADEQIATYLQLFLSGRHHEAWLKIREDNPFPAVCGRVCYHPCETVCNRGYFDAPIAIHATERFAEEWGRRQRELPVLVGAKRDERVAIIGAGPAGLTCAYFLALKGYRVTVFEALPVAGGMMRVGIPEYRLPRDVLGREIADITALGVQIVANKRLGDNLSFADLAEFQAVYLAMGAHKGRRLDVPGEDLPGVLSGLEFLLELNLGRTVDIGNRVAVVGGGNTAMDVSRSALRLGAKPVVVYRRSREEMPAILEEIEEAEREGVDFLYMAAPKAVTKAGNGLRLDLSPMRFTAPDSSGRRGVEPVPDGRLDLKVDTILLAIGEEPELDVLAGEGLEISKGQIVVDNFGRTNRPGIFAGGDLASSSRRVVDAIGMGKRAATGIDAFLRGVEAVAVPRPRPIPFPEIDQTSFQKSPRVQIPTHLQTGGATQDFQEVNQTIGERGAFEEAERCFSCGVCTYCDKCMRYCPDLAIRRLRGEPGYVVNLNLCKGCSICVEVCPREAMDMEGIWG